MFVLRRNQVEQGGESDGNTTSRQQLKCPSSSSLVRCLVAFNETIVATGVLGESP
jgi:hypothetical protein